MQGLGTEHATHFCGFVARPNPALVIAHHSALMGFCDFVKERKWIQRCRLPGNS
jgi:hypothetical protein